MELVGRIVASPLFSRAPKLQDFLIYIAERSVLEQDNLITEYVIGVEVFKRSPGYSPGEDNIVRSYARTLRKRLEEYFSTIGSEETIVISIPRGAYALVFHSRAHLANAVVQPVADPALPSEETPEEGLLQAPQKSPSRSSTTGKMQRRGVWRSRATGFTALAVFLLALFGAYRLGQRSTMPAVPRSVHRFWAGLAGNRPTLIVPDDTGLTVTLGLIQRDITPQDYVSGQYRKELASQFPQLVNWDKPFAHRYTDFVDLLAISRFTRMPELTSHPLAVQYARDLRPQELGLGNVILMGGSNANPWVRLFDQDLNYTLHFLPQERTFEILNRHPQTGEPASYPYVKEKLPLNYGLVAVRPNLTNTGNVLVLEGVTNSGLQAAIDFCFDDRLLANIESQILSADGAMRPFEALVRTRAVGSSPTRVELVGFRND